MVLHSQELTHNGKLSVLVTGEGLTEEMGSSNKTIWLIHPQDYQMSKAYLMHVMKLVHLTDSQYIVCQEHVCPSEYTNQKLDRQLLTQLTL